MWLLWVWPSVRYRSICIAVGDYITVGGIARCPLFRGCFTIGVYEATIRTWESVRYKGGVRSSEVSVKRGSTAGILLFTYLFENVFALYAMKILSRTQRETRFVGFLRNRSVAELQHSLRYTVAVSARACVL